MTFAAPSAIVWPIHLEYVRGRVAFVLFVGLGAVIVLLGMRSLNGDGRGLGDSTGAGDALEGRDAPARAVLGRERHDGEPGRGAGSRGGAARADRCGAATIRREERRDDRPVRRADVEARR